MTKKEIEKICKKVINYPFLVICEKRSQKYVIQIHSAFDESLYKKVQEAFSIRNFIVGLSYSTSNKENNEKHISRRFDISLTKRAIYESFNNWY